MAPHPRESPIHNPKSKLTKRALQPHHRPFLSAPRRGDFREVYPE
jgi:hypothetical protein